MNQKINGFSFNAKYVEKLKSFDEFYTAYKGAAFTLYDEATQKKMLEQAWKVLAPKAKAEKQG